MKKAITIFAAFLLLASASVYSQEIVRDEVDKFTKSHIKETSRETLKSQFRRFLRQKFKSVDGIVFLYLTYTYHSAFRIDEGSSVYLLLEDGESIKITCTRGGVADYNHDRNSNTTFWYGSFPYLIRPDIIPTLLEKKIVAVRTTVGDEYDVWEDIKEKNAKKFQKMLEMVR